MNIQVSDETGMLETEQDGKLETERHVQTGMREEGIRECLQSPDRRVGLWWCLDQTECDSLRCCWCYLLGSYLADAAIAVASASLLLFPTAASRAQQAAEALG